LRVVCNFFQFEERLVKSIACYEAQHEHGVILHQKTQVRVLGDDLDDKSKTSPKFCQKM
jgi:hypothetical protein